jgi:hypothetical protein
VQRSLYDGLQPPSQGCLRHGVQGQNQGTKEFLFVIYNKNSFFYNYFAVLQNGFFVEAGAASCDFDSVTLPFELHLNWTGKALPTLYQVPVIAMLRIRITLSRIRMRI